MAFVDFSEATFQFLYLREALAAYAPSWQVTIPTLKQETRLGYDAQLINSVGHSVFYQFKRPNARRRRSGNDRRLGILPPYYQFKLHSTKQHNTMCRLAARHHNAFYVSPAISTTADLMSTAIAGALQLNSVEIDPSVSGGLVRKVDHRYVYTDARSASFHSNGGDVIELPPAGVRLEALIKSEPQSLALLLFEILEATQSKTPRLTLELKGGKSNIPELLDSAAQQLRELDIHWCLLTRT